MPAPASTNDLWIKSLIDSKTEQGILTKPAQYRNWSIQTKGKLLKKGLFCCVSKDFGKDSKLSSDDEKAMGIILECLNDDMAAIAITGGEDDNPKTMWDRIKSYCNQDSLINVKKIDAYIRDDRLSNYKDMAEYLMATRKLYGLLSGSEHKDYNMSLTKLMTLVTDNLPADYSFIVNRMREQFPKTLDDFSTQLISFEGENNLKSSSKTQTALKTDAKEITCWNCTEKGHFSSKCPKKKKPTKKSVKSTQEKRSKESKDPKDTSTKKQKVVALVAVAKRSNPDNLVTFLIDSGCSNHITNEISLLQNQSRTNVDLIIADGSKIKATTTGIVYGQSVRLDNVLHYDNLDQSLLSVKQLAKEGYKFAFTDGLLMITTPNGEKIRVDADESGMFYVGFPLPQSVYSMHELYGHPGEKITRELQRQGVQINIRDDCGICIKSKGRTNAFSKKGDRVETGKVISYDIVGPMESTSIDSEKYALVLVHHETDATFVQPLKTKGEQGGWIESITRRILAKGFLVDTVVCDNSLENLSNSLKRFYADNGIEIKSSNVYTSNQNAKCERRIRSLMDKTRCLLLDSKLSKRYWSFAIMTAAFLMNLTNYHNGKNSYERWHGKPYSPNRLFQFGAKILVQIKPRTNVGKLDSRFDDGVFLGYSNNGYVALVNNSVVYSRDIKLNGLKTMSPTRLPCSDTESESNSDCDSTNSQETSSNDNSSDVESEQSSTSSYYDAEGSDGDYQNAQRSKSTDTAGISQQNIIEGKRTRKQFIHRAYKLSKLMKQDVAIPVTYQEAMNSKFHAQWAQAVKDEMEQLIKLRVFTVVPIPDNRHLMDSKYVFTTMINSANEVVKFKARLCARGFTQLAGIDYTDTYSSVAPIAVIKAILVVAIRERCVFKQLDVKTAYLHAKVEEDLYMKIPINITAQIDSSKYCWKLNKALYGTKQGAKCWNDEISTTLKKIGLRQSCLDSSVFVGKNAWIVVYVDDLLLIGRTSATNFH
jgi:hypothetical protein